MHSFHYRLRNPEAEVAALEPRLRSAEAENIGLIAKNSLHALPAEIPELRNLSASVMPLER